MAIKKVKATKPETKSEAPVAPVKAEAPKAAVKKAEEPKAAAKKAEAPKAAAKKAEEPKAAVKKAEAPKKTAAKKSEAPKKTAAKKAEAPKKTTAAKKSVNATTFEIQYAGKNITTDYILAKFAEVSKKKTVKDVKFYVQPENGVVYYIADSEEGHFEI